MSNTAPVKNRVPKILIVGGGYAGFYTAWKLEKHLRRGEAEVTIVDPLPYMTYQPFLPEVAAGSIEARHSVVALRRHLKKTKIVAAKVTGKCAFSALDQSALDAVYRGKFPPGPRASASKAIVFKLH